MIAMQIFHHKIDIASERKKRIDAKLGHGRKCVFLLFTEKL